MAVPTVRLAPALAALGNVTYCTGAVAELTEGLGRLLLVTVPLVRFAPTVSVSFKGRMSNGRLMLKRLRLPG
jgi:hypothetical protein